VAQHCVIVLQLFAHANPQASTHNMLAALLHDAPEYVVGDMISPFKAALGVDYKAFENRLLSAIHLRFGLPPVLDAELVDAIKTADRTSAYLEATQLAGFTLDEGAKFFGRPKNLNGFESRLVPLPTQQASQLYLHSFQRLTGAA
jgi:uncharacterized protein